MGEGFFFDSCCPFSTPLSPKKYVDSLHAYLGASRYFASGWIDRERKREQEKKTPIPISPVNAHVQASPYAVITCFAVLLQPVCLLPPRVAGVAVPAFLSFISPLVFKQQQGVSASAGRSDELPEGLKLE